jgi:1-acyl-sn-glycerol-3-phosphate acyltransferase
MSAAAALPGIHPVRRTFRYYLSRLVVAVLVRSWMRVRLDGRERLPSGPAIYCFNHMNWTDPFMLMATLPLRPRLFFFGPKEEDMLAGGRNRLMVWTGSAIPYKPGKNDLLDATRRVAAVVETGGVVAIAGEGRIHVRESDLLPLSEGAAYFAIRSGIPLVPIAISGTSWLHFGGRIHIRVGEPFMTTGRPTKAAIESLTGEAWQALHDMVAHAPELPRPGRVGRWLTERFNDWPEGSREATLAATAGDGAQAQARATALDEASAGD